METDVLAQSRKKSINRNKWKAFFGSIFFIVASVGWYHHIKPLPQGININGQPHPAYEVNFLGDLTYLDKAGQRHSEQAIFSEILAMIARAEKLVVIDKFLFNNYTGSGADIFRPLSEELTSALLAQKQKYPALQIVFITDPINTVYGALPESHLERLKAAGATVVFTNLSRLRDSNPLYSAWYRLFLAPFGGGPGNTVASPFGEGNVSLRSYFRLLNFKANHRKVIVCDAGANYKALVTSANPHDASSAHDNVALSFTGPAVWDILQAELAVLDFSDGPSLTISPPKPSQQTSPLTVRLVTEKAILHAVLAQIASLQKGDRLDMVMFYLSHRDIVRALIQAQKRGAVIAIALDPNKDAFGREKNGIPNRQVGAELHAAGVTIRWANTHGEQCHSKMLLFQQNHRQTLILGSANLTRRNLDNYNLEMNTVLSGAPGQAVFKDAAAYFHQIWTNENGKFITVPYEDYADQSKSKRAFYRIMEGWGLSTF